jgi:glyoxylase-like metal-dependent hydrolase (beta-lactamase superfamily II)
LLDPRLIDTHQFDRLGAGAAYYINSTAHALVDTGTSLSVPYIENELLSNVHLDYIFVTHVHLDHAGGAGQLARTHPNATVVVHPRGAKHLIDPTFLVESVRQATGDLFALYGEAIPIDSGRVYEAKDGQRFNMGKNTIIEAIYSPGHAPHHLCFFEPESRMLFLGDAAGEFLGGNLFCTTPPPSFDLEVSLQTLDNLRKLHPKKLFYAHFGPAENPDFLLKSYADLLKRWTDTIDAKRRALNVPDLIDTVLNDPHLFPSGIDERLKPELAMSVRGVLSYLEHVSP